MERQVRYNWRRANNPEYGEWWFLIINQNREIEEIKSKIYKLLEPIVNESKKIEGTIKGTGLRYLLINFESRASTEKSQLNQLYKNILQDRNLYTRQSRDGLENYIINSLEG